MTIDELLAAAGLTANDEIPIWDAEATGEPTKKITAQNLAAAVVALANLVTGVKGDAESSYRQGNVNITPANIGALDTSALIDIPHGGTGATTAAGARANLEITPKNIGVLSTSYKLVQATIPANSADDISFYGTSLDDYSLIILGGNSFVNSYREGYEGVKNVTIPIYLAKMCLSQYSFISPPDDSWHAWFTSGSIIHVENRTSNSLSFRCDVYV